MCCQQLEEKRNFPEVLMLLRHSGRLGVLGDLRVLSLAAGASSTATQGISLRQTEGGGMVS